MKKHAICMSLLIVCLFASQALASVLYFDPFISHIKTGESIDVDVAIAWLDNDTDVGAFDFNVCFNDAVLSLDSYSLTDNLGDISAGDADDWSWGDLGDGKVNLAEISWLGDLSFQPDSFALATLSFTGIGAGISPLFFDRVLISDLWGNAIHTIPTLGVIGVKPVPEPATLLLIGTGICGLIGARISRRKKA